jgi:bacterioferritin-associated ferredoxin/NifU-like protein involved in Fe-S cluster formation
VTLRLPDAYVDHLVSPRNRGDVDPADVIGEAGSPVSGTGVRLTLRLRSRFLGSPRVVAAGFRVLGGAAAIAPASWLTERLVGTTLREAGAVDAEEIAAGLGGPPPRVAQAARLVVSALRAGLDARGGSHGADRGILVCRCFLVGDRVVRDAIRAGAATVPEISDACTAGRGCHSCWPDLRSLIDEERADGVPDTADASAVRRVVDAVVRPAWRAQGVALGRVEIDGDTVRLEVSSIDADALAAPGGAVAIAARLLREVLGDEARVEALDRA